MMQPLDQSIIELLSASRDDETTLALAVASRIFGLHAQQAEKLLKVLIGAHGEKYKYTHDLVELGRQCLSLGEQVPIAQAILAELTNFGGVWRYQEPESIVAERRGELKVAVAILRKHVVGRLLVIRPDVDWARYR